MNPRNDLLDHAMNLFPSPTGVLERVIERQRQRQRNRRVAAGGVGVAIAIALLIALGSTGATTDQPAETPTITPSEIGTVSITHTGCTSDGSSNASPGPFTLTVFNDTSDTRTVQLFKITNDARFGRMIAFVGRMTPLNGTHDSHRMWAFPEYGGSTETDVAAHDSIVVSGYLDIGTYGIICFTGKPTERYHPSNFVGPIDVGSG